LDTAHGANHTQFGPAESLMSIQLQKDIETHGLMPVAGRNAFECRLGRVVERPEIGPNPAVLGRPGFDLGTGVT